MKSKLEVINMYDATDVDQVNEKRIADYDTLGIASFEEDDFDVVSGKVSLRYDYGKNTISFIKLAADENYPNKCIYKVSDEDDAVYEIGHGYCYNMTFDATNIGEVVLLINNKYYSLLDAQGNNLSNGAIEEGTVYRVSCLKTDKALRFYLAGLIRGDIGKSVLQYLKVCDLEETPTVGITVDLTNSYFDRTPIQNEVFMFYSHVSDGNESWICYGQVKIIESDTTTVLITGVFRVSTNIEVGKTTTLAPNESATVVDSDISSDSIILDFGIPKGLPGSVGQKSLFITDSAPVVNGTYTAAADAFCNDDGYDYFAYLDVGAGYTIYILYNGVYDNVLYLCTASVIAKTSTNVTFVYNSVQQVTGKGIYSITKGESTTDETTKQNIVSYILTYTDGSTYKFSIADGAPGLPFRIVGTVETEDDLPDASDETDNKAYLVGNDTDGYDLYVQVIDSDNNEVWINTGRVSGIKGDKGETGDPATIAIGTVTTGESGEKASVTNEGTSTNALLDFVLPKGDQGVGISSVTVGTVSTSSGYTITPINFEKTDGTTDTVEVMAENGTVTGTAYNNIINISSNIGTGEDITITYCSLTDGVYSLKQTTLSEDEDTSTVFEMANGTVINLEFSDTIGDSKRLTGITYPVMVFAETASGFSFFSSNRDFTIPANTNNISILGICDSVTIKIIDS